MNYWSGFFFLKSSQACTGFCQKLHSASPYVTEKPKGNFWPTQYFWILWFNFWSIYHDMEGIPSWLRGYSLPAMWKTWVWSLGRKDPLEKKMATHSSILAWKIPWVEEPGGLQGYSPQGHRESDTTELLHFHFHHDMKQYGWLSIVLAPMTGPILGLFALSCFLLWLSSVSQESWPLQAASRWFPWQQASHCDWPRGGTCRYLKVNKGKNQGTPFPPISPVQYFAI